MPKFCGSCGKAMDLEANFCNQCGMKLFQENNKKTIVTWPRYIIISLLVLAIFPWPYWYYLLLRVVVFFSFGYYFFYFRNKCKQSKRDTLPWIWAIGGFAILFNPFIPAHLFRLLWAVFNIAAAYLLYKTIEWEKRL